MTQAPPLLVAAPLTRGGPLLQRVNAKAISYVEESGLRFEDVYPEGVSELRAIAPNLTVNGHVTDAAKEFSAVAGLPFATIYPEHGHTLVVREAELPQKLPRWRVAAALAGFTVGACLVGPLGAVVGAVAVWAAGGRL